MALEKLLKIFAPKDKVFYPLFIQDIENLILISENLVLMMKEDDYEKRLFFIKKIKEFEKVGDNLTHQIFEGLNKSFITPFDREDIHQLASTMDDVADFVNKVAQRIKLYNPKKLMSSYILMSELILEAVKQIEVCVRELEFIKDPEIIRKACDLISEYEHKSDDLYHSGIQDLFNNEKDTVELIKNKEILEVLEKTTDKTEDVADVIKTILVKTT
jgi:predicted phosphate transport protein (TIGR00153 family)